MKTRCSRFAARRSPAFTLVELLVAMTIGVIIVGLSMDSFLQLYKQINASSAYRDAHEDARRSLMWITRDIRSSTGLVSFVSNDLTLVALDNTGGVANIRYYLSQNTLERTYTLGGSTWSNQLTQNLTYLNFLLYNKAGGSGTLSNAYQIRTFMQISNISSYRVSSDLLQSRVRMRNKP